MEATRNRVTVNLPQYLIDDMRRETGNKLGDVDEMVEAFVYEALHTPNPETIEAIKESRSGKYAGTVDTTTMEAFKKSLGI